jgi:hypothetical protein
LPWSETVKSVSAARIGAAMGRTMNNAAPHNPPARKPITRAANRAAERPCEEHENDQGAVENLVVPVLQNGNREKSGVARHVRDEHLPERQVAKRVDFAGDPRERANSPGTHR